MPKITKQTMKKQSAPSKNGSVLSRVVPIESLHDDHLKIVIYGQNRVGKTTLACTFPKPLLLISFEPAKTGGAKSVKRVPGVEYVHLTSIDDVEKLATELRTDKYFKTHVLDTITSLQDVIGAKILGLPDVPEQWNFGMMGKAEYQQRSEMTKDICRLYLTQNAHTVVLAKEKDHQPPKGDEVWEGYGRRKLATEDTMRIESYFAAAAGTAAVGWLHDACDYICRLYLTKEIIVEEKEYKAGGKVTKQIVERETGRMLRRLRTLYHANYASGFRSETPTKIPEFIESPTYEKILQVIEGRWKTAEK